HVRGVARKLILPGERHPVDRIEEEVARPAQHETFFQRLHREHGTPGAAPTPSTAERWTARSHDDLFHSSQNHGRLRTMYLHGTSGLHGRNEAGNARYKRDAELMMVPEESLGHKIAERQHGVEISDAIFVYSSRQDTHVLIHSVQISHLPKGGPL